MKTNFFNELFFMLFNELFFMQTYIFFKLFFTKTCLFMKLFFIKTYLFVKLFNRAHLFIVFFYTDMASHSIIFH